MKRRVVIKGLPKAQSGLETKMHNLRAGLGFNANTMPWPIMAGKLSEPPLQTNNTLRPVPREEANVEAEKDEVAVLPTKSGIPDTKIIGGKRHYQGGTPLKLPTDTFIFSDTAKMRIKDPVILAQFGFPEKKNGFTPAEIAKKYDITPFKKILMDKNADVIQQKTAELMISNYNMKLAKLALYQESMKGFPQGLPAIAQPYVESMNIDPEMFAQENPGGETDDETVESDMMAQYGKQISLMRADNGKQITDVNAYINDMVKKGQVPKGFKSAEDAKDFVKDPRNHTPYLLFLNNFYKSGADPKQRTDMIGASGTLADYNVENSWGWLPWGTDQDKVENFAGILKEKADNDLKKYNLDKSMSQLTGAQKQLDANELAIKNKIAELRKTDPGNTQIVSYENYLKNIADQKRDIKLHKAGINAEYEYAYKPYTPSNMAEIMGGGPSGIITSSVKNPLDFYTADRLKGDADKIFNISKPPATLTQGKGSETGQPAKDSTKTVNVTPNAAAKDSLRNKMAKENPNLVINQVQPSDSSKVVKVVKKEDQTIKDKINKSGKTSNITYRKGNFRMGGSTGEVKRVIIKKVPEYAYGGYFAGGGSVALPRADNGKIVAPSADVYPVGWEMNGDTPPKYALKWSDGSYTNKQATPPSNAQHAETKKLIRESKPSKKVPPEIYQKLKELYEKAKEKEPDAKGRIRTPEAEEFQKLYHKYLPLEAQRIIASDPKPTGKCAGTGDAYYNFECNEDGLFGSRTKQYMERLEEIQKQEDDKPTTETTEVKEDKKETTTTTTPTKFENLDQTKRPAYIPPSPWVQDVNLANKAFLNWAGVKGYYPDLVQTRYRAPELFFQSPERTLAENQSQMNMAANILGKTQRPQDFYGGWAAISGPGFSNAANTIANVHGQNINIANQEAAARAQAYNQNQAMNAQALKQYIDETNATLQGIQNARTQRSDEYTKAKNALITNMANKYNLNMLNPQFAVDPYGMVYFHDPRDLKPEDQQLAISKRYQQMLKDNPVEAKTEEGRKRLWEMTKLEAGIQETSYDDPLSQYERAKNKGVTPYAKYPGNTSE